MPATPSAIKTPTLSADQELTVLGLDALEWRHHGGHILMPLMCDGPAERPQARAAGRHGSQLPFVERRQPHRLERPAPYLQQLAVRAKQQQRAIGRDHLDAGFLGGRVQIESLAELGTHHALECEHEALQLTVEALVGQAILHDRDGDAAVTSTTTITRPYQAVRRDRMDQVIDVRRLEGRRSACTLRPGE